MSNHTHDCEGCGVDLRVTGCECVSSDRGMSDLIERTRRHVASYKTLTRHRQDCLDMCDEIERLTAGLKQANKGFEEYERKYYLQRDEIERQDEILDDIWDQCNDSFTGAAIRINKIASIIRQHSKPKEVGE